MFSFSIQPNSEVTCNVISDECFPIQRRILLGQQLFDRTLQPCASRMEESVEEAHNGNSWFAILRYHSVLHAAELAIADQLNMSMDKRISVPNSQLYV